MLESGKVDMLFFLLDWQDGLFVVDRKDVLKKGIKMKKEKQKKVKDTPKKICHFDFFTDNQTDPVYPNEVKQTPSAYEILGEMTQIHTYE